MERYTRWRDSGTGVLPFLPRPVLRAPLWQVPFAALRMLLAMLVVITWTAVGAAAGVLRLPRVWLHALFARAALWALTGAAGSVRRMQRRADGKGYAAAAGPATPADAFLPGDVVAANHQSVLDVLWAVGHARAVCVVLPVLGSGSCAGSGRSGRAESPGLAEGMETASGAGVRLRTAKTPSPQPAVQLVAVPPWAAMLLCGRVLRAESKCPFWRLLRRTVVVSVSDLRGASSHARVLGGTALAPFEGSATNGAGILRPVPGVCWCAAGLRLHVVGVGAPGSGEGRACGVAQPLPGMLLQALWSCVRAESSHGGGVVGRWLPAPAVSSAGAANDDDGVGIADAAAALAQPSRPVVALGVWDKASFVDYHRSFA